MKTTIKTHILKLSYEYWNDVMSGMKSFELRKNDRDFQLGDLIIFQECHPMVEQFTPIRSQPFRIIYILKDVPQYGLKNGYAILGIIRDNTL